MKIKKRDKEEPIVGFDFNVFKFNNRPKPTDKRRITLISCLSEFGCEVIGVHYCLPRIVQERSGDYIIAVGWWGREYMYRHLVDEFWEIKEEHQWLRDFTKAFHNDSKNLARLEESLQEYGKVIKSEVVGQIAVGNYCQFCKHWWAGITYSKVCPKCGAPIIVRSLFSDVKTYRNEIRKVPPPSAEKLAIADKYLKPNSVGIFARGRKTYGRNLQPEFYVKLIGLLRSMGYNPIWLGEKQSTLPCPVADVLDYSRLSEARDMELTVAIVSKCKFTMQMWTASTRISCLAGTPFLLVESPMQIWGEGQEGMRLNLLKELAPRKLVICHYLNVLNNNDQAIDLLKSCIKEMEVGNYEDVIGMVDERPYVEQQRRLNLLRIGD
jgi:hypothetical protein